MAEWCNVSRAEVTQRGAWPLIRQYGSLEGALKAVYPEYPWHKARFVAESKTRVPRGHWKAKSNLVNALARAEEKLEITKVV